MRQQRDETERGNDHVQGRPHGFLRGGNQVSVRILALPRRADITADRILVNCSCDPSSLPVVAKWDDDARHARREAAVGRMSSPTWRDEPDPTPEGILAEQS